MHKERHNNDLATQDKKWKKCREGIGKPEDKQPVKTV